MVRMFSIRQYIGPFEAFFQIVGNTDIIDAPALVIGPRVGPKTPPGIAVRLGVKFAEGVNHAVVKPFVHPGALFGQKAGGVFVAHRIVNIDGLVANVVIAAHHQSG